MSTEIANTNAANTTSTLADRQAYVAGFAKGQIVTAIVVGSNNTGLTVNLADNSPVTALCLGLSQSERDTIMASVTAGTLVSFAVEVVEVDPRSTDANGNIRARLVVRLSHSEANKLASLSTFVGQTSSANIMSDRVFMPPDHPFPGIRKLRHRRRNIV